MQLVDKAPLRNRTREWNVGFDALRVGIAELHEEGARRMLPRRPANGFGGRLVVAKHRAVLDYDISPFKLLRQFGLVVQVVLNSSRSGNVSYQEHLLTVILS